MVGYNQGGFQMKNIGFLSITFLPLALATSVSLALWPAAVSAADPTPGVFTAIEQLGEAIFHDTAMSIPSNKQGCVSCHDPKVGWVLKDPLGQGAAAGAHPGRRGNQKPPSAAYADDSPVFAFVPPPGPLGTICGAVPTPGLCYKGGIFWNGRATGAGQENSVPVGGGAIETIKSTDVGIVCAQTPDLCEYLGPTADQAAAPFLNPVEQNSRMKKVCQRIKTAPYKTLYNEAFGEPIDCQKGGLKQSHLRAALAIAAYEASNKVNRFTSAREACLKDFASIAACDKLSADAKAGHTLFYRFGPGGAACAGCHNNGKGANGAQNTYADHRYHHLPLPFNNKLGVSRGEVTGLSSHITDGTVAHGEFKTPTLLNVALGEGQKTYMHNGYFKTLKQVVHFYNTATAKPACANSSATIDEIWIKDSNAGDAVNDGHVDCWPVDEFVGTPVPGIVGNLGLTSKQEDQLVEYLRALSDGFSGQAN
jgi:cytochrome c peroxidase